jgi:signal transduction histidine kinase
MSESSPLRSTFTYGDETVGRALAKAGVDRHSGPQSTSDWTSFLGHLRAEISASSSSAFRDLFHDSPAPTMSQDYTRVIDWMNQLHREGVWNLSAYLDGRIDRLREAVQLIEITAINPAGVRVMGGTRRQALGPVDPALVSEGSTTSWTLQLATVWNGERSARIEFEGMHRNGSTFDARLTMAVPELGGMPDYRRCIVTIYDISDERRREREMQQLIDAKNRFVSVVSHEIRTPMSAVLAYAELLREENRSMSEDDRQEVLDVLAREAGETANLVEDLLIATRAELGALSVLSEPVDIVTELEAVLAGLRVGGFSVDIDDAVVGRRCSGDAKRIRQILRNLITNAERYGGAARRIEVTLGEDSLRLAVCDNGEGVPDDEANAIFDEFGRASGGMKVADSVGLGLSVSRRLAEAMGGALTYRNEAGWTTFELELRADRSASP